jgi:hypothetical protein
MSDKDENNEKIKTAYITGAFTLLAALVAGVFLLIRTFIEQENFVVSGVLFIVVLVSIILFTSYVSRLQVAKSITRVAAALPSWKLLYEHDENGKAIVGDPADLVDAVGKAYPIKIKIFREQRLETMEAQWLFVENGLVHASNVDQISLGPDASGNYIYFDQPYHYAVIVNSRGHHHASRLNFDGTKKNSTNENRHMAWFGLVPPGFS